MNDSPKSQESMLAVLEKTSGPGRAELLQLLPLVQEPKLDDLLKQFANSSEPALAAAARKARKYMSEEIGVTDGFIGSWSLSGPYPVEGGVTVFAPEIGEKADWKPYQCPEKQGPRVVPLKDIFGGDNRVAYMKAVVRSDATRLVRFGAGSDDGIKVWLNGELIQSNPASRAVKADEDRFTGTLKAGENVILCKIQQHSQGWGGCLSIRAADGGAALGVSVKP